MDEYLIRPAIEAEATVIQQMVRQARLNPTGLDWRRFHLAVDPQGQVLGCIQLKPHRDGSQELASLMVAEAARGRGIARALIEHLLAIYTGPLYLMCRDELGPFYVRFGFQPLEIEAMPTYFRRIARLVGMAEWMRREGSALLVMQRSANQMQ